jgi:DNA-binding MarR family transcriptional regulator
LSSQIKIPRRTAAPEAWLNLLRGHAATTRALNADLVANHGLSINAYEVLLFLAHASERTLRRGDLAEHVLLTPSGITRLVDGLERAGYVERDHCETDRRVVYARLTDAGLEKLRAARHTHLAGIRTVFTERFSDDELDTLADLLGRLPVEDVGACSGD